MIQLTDRVRVPEGVHMQNVSGEAIILNLQSERYYGLDEVGTTIWDVLSSGGTIQAAIDAVLAAFDADAPTVRADVLELVTRLIEQGLLELDRSG
jgi:hypothetical protein